MKQVMVMLGLDIASIIMMGIACFLFAGFVSLFIVSDLFVRIVYLVPLAIRHVKKGRVQPTIIGGLFKRPLLQISVVLLLLGIAYALDQQTFFYLFTSPVGIVCCLLPIPALIWMLIFQRGDYLDEYYIDAYMEYATVEERQRYREIIRNVSRLSIVEAREALLDKDVSFIERKALTERILMIQASEMSASEYQ